MNDFSKRIASKKESDRKLLNQSTKRIYNRFKNNTGAAAENIKADGITLELYKILDYFGMDYSEVPDDIYGDEQKMQYIMSTTGLLRRKIALEAGWWKCGSTPLLCMKKDGTPTAVLQSHSGKNFFFDGENTVRVTEKNADDFEPDAYCFYKPFPDESISVWTFWKFILRSFTVKDVISLLAISLIVAAFGLILPVLNSVVFNFIVPSGTEKKLFGILALFIGSTVVSSLFYLSRSIWVTRIGNKIDLSVQNAVWARVMNLPIDFFKKYDSGELAQRAAAINQICEILGGQMIPTILGTVFSFVYFFQIRSLSPSLAFPSLIIIFSMLAVSLISAYLNIKYAQRYNETDNKLSSMVFQLINGITKIKVAGAEIRAYNKWSELFSKLEMIPSRFIVISDCVNTVVSFGGTIILYVIAYRTSMSTSDYIAFNTAFGAFSAAVLALSGLTQQIASLKPSMDMLNPILEQKPENSGYKKHVKKLSGNIEVNQVSFRYTEDTPYILDNFSLSIEPGEYLGIVGSSGCGKSTLIRLLLGFETAETGSVYYDMQDISGLDIRSVRQRIGVVLQNGKLFSGDIYSNIVVCAPWLSIDDAWEAAEKSGLAEDIRKMPMGMFTMLSDGGGGLSGGQQQRLLIARAIAANPDILMFDEAISALDNITQAQVVNTLKEMNCTRLVIAHRLSTIKDCSRIIYMHKGKIIEEGTYDELIRKNGAFAEMAQRQLL